MVIITVANLLRSPGRIGSDIMEAPPGRQGQAGEGIEIVLNFSFHDS